MARQRIHNSRAGRGGNGGASWISYSDMMAALLLVFVLILSMSLHQYFTMLETKTKELDEQRNLVILQQSTLDAQTMQIASQQVTLDYQTHQLVILQNEINDQKLELENAYIVLGNQQAQLEEARTTLGEKEAKLIILQEQLANKEMELNAAQQVLTNQQAALLSQTEKIDDLVGMRTQIISDLSVALSSANLKAAVDENGDIVLDSAVLFKTNSSTILPAGKTMLDRFIPVYLSVLLQPKYQEYLAEICIVGYTDTDGEYINNLELSQNRALNVAKYVLQLPTLSSAQRTLLQEIMTATGRGESDPIYNWDGSENKDASRRVEFKFRLKDAEMIEEMNKLLQGQQ